MCLWRICSYAYLSILFCWFYLTSKTHYQWDSIVWKWNKLHTLPFRILLLAFSIYSGLSLQFTLKMKLCLGKSINYRIYLLRIRSQPNKKVVFKEFEIIHKKGYNITFTKKMHSLNLCIFTYCIISSKYFLCIMCVNIKEVICRYIYALT